MMNRRALPGTAIGFALIVGILSGPLSGALAQAPGQTALPSGAAKIGESLTEYLRSSGVGDESDRVSARGPSILIILKAQANLRGAELLKSKDEKGRFVYDQLRQIALTTQGDLVELLREYGVEFQRFHILNAIVVEHASRTLIRELSLRDDVGRVIANPAVKSRIPQLDTDTSVQASPFRGVGDNIKRVGANRVWVDFKVKGEGIVIGTQDTGVKWDHPALIGHYRGNKTDPRGVSHDFNWHDSVRKALGAAHTNRCGYLLKAPCDDQDHGTHTLGTAIGDDGKGNMIGMAPGAKWIACRGMDAGVGAPANYLECFEWFLAPYPTNADPMRNGDPTKAPHVINNSWACPKEEGCEGGELLPVVNSLRKAGILVVAAAGNDGPDCLTINAPPASYSDGILSVGAINHRNEKIAFFSSRGPSKYDGGIGPDVMAPGVSIRSSTPDGEYQEANWSGTSMASPHVVGEVALLWSAKKALIGDIDKTIKIIRDTAEPRISTQMCGGVPGNVIPNNTYGYGVIDAYQAVKSVLRPRE